MSKAKKETMWMAWHVPTSEYVPWMWHDSRKLLRETIDRQQEFPQEFMVKRVRIAEIKPKRKASK